MKVLIALFISAFALSANASLESHYGEMKWAGGHYTCEFTNHGAAKDMKWVVFVTEGLSGHANTYETQVKVDRVVDSGDTIVAESTSQPYRYVWYCKFLERKGYHPTPEEPTPN